MQKNTEKVLTENTDLLLKVEDLAVSYTSEDDVVKAVNGVSFDVVRGKTLGLVGETGAGKTTIAKAIMGILPDISSSVDSGKIMLDGQDLLSISEKEYYKIRGKKISMIFQDPMTSLNPVMSVGPQIAEAIRLHSKISKAEARKKAEEMLALVRIPKERYKDYPHQFSGGMKQRVVIAIALACNPELLLADEPTTALDVTIQAQVLEIIRDLREVYNTSMIMISHDLGVIAETCDDVAVVYAGEIVEYGSLEDIFDHPTHPYTLGLFGAIPDLDKRVDRLTVIPGLPPDPTNLPSGCKFNPRCRFATDACRNEDIPLHTISGKHVCRCCRIEEKGENR